MRKFYALLFAFTSFLSVSVTGQTYHPLSSGSFTQNWANTGLITVNDSWSGVPGIQGFLGQDITTGTGIDPQTLVAGASALPNDLDVIANQSSTSITNGGVAEFDGIANPVIALQGSGTADAPFLVIYLDATGKSNINVSYKLRDIDGSIDNAIQPVALQYRIGNSGNFTNIPAAFVADATSGPSLATLETLVNINLPAACDNQSQLQLRIITSNAVGSDEWVGIDDINISAGGTPATTASVAAGTTAAEPSTSGTFNVTLSSPAPAGGITVTYSLAGSATLNTDYTNPQSGTVIIAENSISAVVDINVNDDPDFEGTETIEITLTGATTPVTIGTGAASINLSDNDMTPSVSVVAGITAAEPATNGTFTINLSSPAPPGGLTVNYTLTGTAVLNTDYTDPLSGSIVIPEGNSTGTVTLNVNDDAFVEGSETIIITLDNASNGYVVGTPASANINILDNDNPPIVVNEVYGGGGNTGATYKNDFIELFNNGNTPFNLAGWSVQYNSSTGTGTWQVTNLTGTIPAHGFYLIQEAAGAGGSANLPTPDASGGIAMAAGAGKVALVNNLTALTGQNPLSTAIVDKVGYGSVTGGGFEGAGSAPVPSATNSIQRTPVGFDSNNNNTDFTLGLPTPKNSVTDLTPPTVSVFSPAHTATNAAIAFIATVTFNENVEKGTGNITLKKTSDGSTVQTINVSGTDVAISGSTVSFLIQSLAYNTSYYFEIDNAAFRDLSANDFAGFSGSGTWSFTTSSQPIGTVGTTYNFNTCTSGLTDGFAFYSEAGPQIWGCTSFGRNAADLPLGSAPNGVQVNGFSGTNIPNIDWLISPSFDLTSTVHPLLSFWSRTAFNGKPLELKVSTDYNGGNPSAATWIDLNGKFPEQTSNKWTLSENINLSAFKQSNVHFAFVYTSTDDEGARWTLDDISVINSLVPPPPALTVSTGDIQFTYVAAGLTADKTFTFIGNDLTDNVTLNATGNFLLSKDGISFSSSLNYTIAEANDQFKTVYVRFVPSQNNQDFSGSVTVATSTLSSLINLKGTSIDPATTLEVLNWNVEWFGSAVQAPNNDDQQEQNVETILKSIGADVYGLVEVVDEARLARVVSHMPGYSYVISNYGSHTNTTVNPVSALAEAQKLAFVYKTSIFSNISTTPLLSQGINTAADISNPAYSYWASGRFPYMMSADVTLNCVTKTVKFILVHAKANTAPTAGSYDRRKKGADTLHHLLQQDYANDNLIILGDYNDDLDQSITDGFTITSWNSFTNDVAGFTPVTLPLSLAGKKSTVSFNDVIDHVTLSNDFAPYYLDGTASILSDVSSLVSNYGSTTTDHFPVFSRYRFSNTTAPSVTCPTQFTSCVTNSGTYTIPAFIATDDCGDAVSYSYEITGATTRSGLSDNASGAFNVGVSTIAWTATDSWGNSSTCNTTVIINANPTVTIPDVYALSSGTLPNTVYIGYAPASSLTLNAQAAGGNGGYTYNWSNGSLNTSITVSPTVSTAYSVIVTDNNGCQATANKTVNVVDVRSGKKLDKVIVCHSQSGTPFTLVVSNAEVPIHLSHGDMLGGCAVATRSITRNYSDEENTTGKLALRVLPNPSANFFTISIGPAKNETISMKVTDVMGRIIEYKQNLVANQSLKIGNNYTTGMYFVVITQGMEKATLKLVKL